MVNLPNSNRLNIAPLTASFNNVTNSYKFYWFLAILEHVRTRQSRTILINDLLAQMVAGVWYPANYFRLSFGKQDRLSQITVAVGAQARLPMDAKRQEVIQTSLSYLVGETSIAYDLKSLGQYVPYRFLRPFFTHQLKGLDDWKVNENIENLAAQTFTDPQNPCIYRFITQPANAIEIHPDWFEYLIRHLVILTGFCLWNLINYIQKNNPNVPNIPNKLFEPKSRDLRQAHTFWKLVFDRLGELTCIYSGQTLQKNAFSLDHFLPWRFVGHDLLWNIIPTPKSVNSTKSDNLPDIDHYFDVFAQLQYKAIQTVAASDKAYLLEDHTLLLGVSSIAEIQGLPFQNFREKLHDTMAPQFQIATNMGFAGHWIYA